MGEVYNIISCGFCRLAFKKIREDYYRLSIKDNNTIVHDSFCYIDNEFISSLSGLLDHISNNKQDVYRFYIRCNYRGKNHMLLIFYHEKEINIKYPTISNCVYLSKFIVDKDTISSLELFVNSL